MKLGAKSRQLGLAFFVLIIIEVIENWVHINLPTGKAKLVGLLHRCVIQNNTKAPVMNEPFLK
jgi:hypothetical protein